MEMEALRLQNDALKAENARLKETRAAIYKLYLEAEGKSGLHHPFTRGTVFKALQLSADPDRVKKEPAPNSGRKPKAKPDEVAPAEEVKVEVEPDEVKVELEVEPDNRTLEEKYQDLVDASVVAKAWRAEEMRKAMETVYAWAEHDEVEAALKASNEKWEEDHLKAIFERMVLFDVCSGEPYNSMSFAKIVKKYFSAEQYAEMEEAGADALNSPVRQCAFHCP